MKLTKHIVRLLALVAVIVTSMSAHGQTDPQFSHYFDIPTFYNPAAIGQTDNLRIRGGGRLQWVGIDNAPTSFVATGDMPFKFIGKKFGVGAVVMQESIGLYSTLNLDAQIGYKFKKFGGEFTAALSVGMYDQSFKGSEVYLPDDDDYHQGTDDAIPTSDIHGTTLDLGVGLWYNHPKFWAGLSMTHLNSPTISMEAEGSSGESQRSYEFSAKRTLYFMAGGNIPIKNTLFEVMPSVLVASDFTFNTGQITARARYRKFLNFGLGYRWKDAVTLLLGAEFKNFYIAYSYDYATSAIAKASSGSHEIFLGYSLKLNLGDKNKNRHKAIRLM